jgi:uncharacterized membrane protein
LLTASHAFAATVALPLGAYQLFRRPQGDLRHRRIGRIWAIAMLYVAVSSFWIRDLRHGRLSLLHVLSVVTLVGVLVGIRNARRGNIAGHRANMRGAWLGLVGAFIGAMAVPSRLLPQFAMTEPRQALGALATAAVTTVAVLGVATLLDRGGRPDVDRPALRGRRSAGRVS